MKISVVMATYNGEKYIEEQLDSIRRQSLSPDEVLICDDGSQDNTGKIVSEYILRNGLSSSWHYIRNAVNKGVVLNFLDGAQNAIGDVIFYCDQDDIWDEKKLEMMKQGFLIYQDMLACYCLRDFVDANGDKINLRFDFMNNVKIRINGFQKVSINEAVRYNKSPGLCLGIKKSLIQETREMILDKRLTHDLPIGTVASIHNGYYVLNKKLVLYRQHESNVSSARYSVKSRLLNIEKQIQGRQLRLNQMKAILNYYREDLSEVDLKHLEEAINITEESIINLKEKNVLKLFLSIFNMNPMINNWISVNNFLVSIRS